jgi:hypothetical protein
MIQSLRALLPKAPNERAKNGQGSRSRQAGLVLLAAAVLPVLVALTMRPELAVMSFMGQRQLSEAGAPSFSGAPPTGRAEQQYTFHALLTNGSEWPSSHIHESPSVAATGQDSSSAPVLASPTIPSYSLQVQVDYGAATVQVQQITRFRNATGLALDRAVFQVATAHAGAFRLWEVSADGQPAIPSLNGTVLEVPLPALLEPGARAEVRLAYQLSVPRKPGRLSAGTRVLTLGNWFPTLAPHRGDWDRHQYTDVGDAFVTEVADFDVQLSTSIPVVVAASGRVLEQNGASFRLEALGVRDFALSLSPDYVIAETSVGGAVVRAYTFSQRRSQIFADSAAKFLGWYSHRFGTYPYAGLSVAEVELPSGWSGMEYPTLIFLSSAEVGTPSPFEGSFTDVLIGHETAHQWFYSLVGNDQVLDPWLDEAFAQYLPYYYYRDASPALFSTLWNGHLSGLDGRISAAGGRPVNASVYDFPDDGPYFTTVYGQGARFLDELRQTMGDTAFEAAIADQLTTFADKLTSPRAVLDLFQRHSPTNLNPLISRYFSYGAFGYPAPANWRLESPAGVWQGSAYLFVGADFPVAQVEVWLDGRRLYVGEQNAVTVDLSGVEPGQYALLVRLWDHRGVQFERARRVSVAAAT